MAAPMAQARGLELDKLSEYILPSRLPSHLRRLLIEYERSGQKAKAELVRSAKFLVSERTDFDNWNGGTTGHDVALFVPEVIFRQVPLSEQRELAESIRTDLAECTGSIQNEYWRAVQLEAADENDPQYQRALGANRSAPDPDRLSFWRPGQIRLFISHRDAHKRYAFELAETLYAFGISSFVAHETIEATKEWRKEIMNGLETMEAMLVFLTDDFAESPFTNQEVGYALGRGVPIISIKLQSRDPPGFIAHEQALRGSLGQADEDTAIRVQRLLAAKLSRQDRLQTSTIAAFVSSPSWADTTQRFDRMAKLVEKLTDAELKMIQEGFAANDQLHFATYLQNKSDRLVRFLKRTTGRDFEVKERKLVPLASDDIPF